ncbi:MAG: DinB family protein [Bacteroidota bacterium]
MENSTTITDALWTQFGASLDMLENAIIMCPDEHRYTATDFWYLSFHCIFWTDYYLSTAPNDFEPPQPFDFSEFDPSGKKPNRTYTKAEILAYVEHCRQKANRLIREFTPEKMNDRWINEYKNYSMLEILLYNMRHVQHHAAQLNILLRQTIDKAPNWVGQARKIIENKEG